jgi:hypothetical protein
LIDHRLKTRTLAEQDIMDFFYYSSLLFFLQFSTLSEGRPNSDIDIGTCKCQSFQTCQWSNESFERINSGTQFPGETQLFKGILVLKPCIFFFLIPVEVPNHLLVAIVTLFQPVQGGRLCQP